MVEMVGSVIELVESVFEELVVEMVGSVIDLVESVFE